jgi:hypothetical protein
LGRGTARPLVATQRRRRPLSLRGRFRGHRVGPLRVGSIRAARQRGAGAPARPLPVARAGRIGGPLSGAIGGSSKTARRGPRSAAALFRIRRSLGFVAEPMFYRRPADPSRRRHREVSRAVPFFRAAKRAARADPNAPPAPRRVHYRRAVIKTFRLVDTPAHGNREASS